jgi:CubicO group peptidase (beta-lactamase class C family)
VQKNILTPLGLNRSYFGTTPYHLAADRSNNYTLARDSASARDTVVDNGRDFDPGITIPNGGWNAPIADLATYVAFLVRATHGDTAVARRYDTVLRHETLEEMWRPRYEANYVGDTSGIASQVGLSFFILTYKGTTFIGHSGTQAGFRGFVYFNPRTGAAVIAALNTSDERPEGQPSYQDVVKGALGLIGDR